MKKLILWYLKWTVIGNGVITLMAFLIGNMIRGGVIKQQPLVSILTWWNDFTCLGLKSSKPVWDL